MSTMRELWRIRWVVHVLSMALSRCNLRTRLHAHLCNVTVRLGLQCWHCHAPMHPWERVAVLVICAKRLAYVVRWHAPKAWSCRIKPRFYVSVAVLKLRVLRRQGRSIGKTKLLLLVRQCSRIVRKPVCLGWRTRGLTMLGMIYILRVYLRRMDTPVWEHLNVLASDTRC